MKMKKSVKSKKGMTLVEIVAVIAIIVILASVGYYGYIHIFKGLHLDEYFIEQQQGLCPAYGTGGAACAVPQQEPGQPAARGAGGSQEGEVRAEESVSGSWRGWEARLWGSSSVFYIDSILLPRGTLPTP